MHPLECVDAQVSESLCGPETGWQWGGSRTIPFVWVKGGPVTAQAIRSRSVTAGNIRIHDSESGDDVLVIAGLHSGPEGERASELLPSDLTFHLVLAAGNQARTDQPEMVIGIHRDVPAPGGG